MLDNTKRITSASYNGANWPVGKQEQSKTLTLGAAAPSTVTPDSGKVLSSVPVVLDTSVIKAENIKKDVTILGVTGTHEGGGSSFEKAEVTYDPSAQELYIHGSKPFYNYIEDAFVPFSIVGFLVLQGDVDGQFYSYRVLGGSLDEGQQHCFAWIDDDFHAQFLHADTYSRYEDNTIIFKELETVSSTSMVYADIRLMYGDTWLIN